MCAADGTSQNVCVPPMVHHRTYVCRRWYISERMCAADGTSQNVCLPPMVHHRTSNAHIVENYQMVDPVQSCSEFDLKNPSLCLLAARQGPFHVKWTRAWIYKDIYEFVSPQHNISPRLDDWCTVIKFHFDHLFCKGIIGWK